MNCRTTKHYSREARPPLFLLYLRGIHVSDLNNKVLMYSITEFISDSKGIFIFTPTPLCLTTNRDKLMSFLDNYILTEIKGIDEDDKECDEFTKIHVDVDHNWWQNLNNISFPIEPNNYPECIIIEETQTSINVTSYICLYISESYIAFL